MKKKLAALLLVGVMAATALSACNAETGNTETESSQVESGTEASTEDTSDTTAGQNTENTSEPETEATTEKETETPTESESETKPETPTESETPGDKTPTETPNTSEPEPTEPESEPVTPEPSESEEPEEPAVPVYTYSDLNKTMYVKDSVNVRDLPASDGNKVGSLKKNDAVKVTGQCKETKWYRIEYNGNTAYVSNSYLTDTEPVAYTYTELDKTMYTTASVNVRDLPDSSGKKLGTVNKGVAVEVNGQCKETGWYRINFNNKTAYVSDTHLAATKPVTSKEELQEGQIWTDEEGQKWTNYNGIIHPIVDNPEWDEAYEKLCNSDYYTIVTVENAVMISYPDRNNSENKWKAIEIANEYIKSLGYKKTGGTVGNLGESEDGSIISYWEPRE